MKKDFKDKKEWQNFQDDLANKEGLAIVLLDEEGLSNVHASNNNSICTNLIKSKEFSNECERFCGKVYESAIKGGKALKYKCYAGLECVAIPIKDSENNNFVAITGRAYTKLEDYNEASKRVYEGDWKQFDADSFFDNMLLASSTHNLEDVAKRLSNLSDDEKQLLANVNEKVEDKSEEIKVEQKDKPKKENKKVEPKQTSDNKEFSKLVDKFNKQTKEHSKFVENLTKKKKEELKEINAWRSLFSSILDLEYKKACALILEFLNERYDLTSLAWLESRDNRLETILATGDLKTQQIQVSMASDDKRLFKAVKENSSVELRERNGKGKGKKPQTIRLFPITVGKQVRSALILGEKVDDKKVKSQIAKFCQNAAPELEILRLREELSRQSWLGIALKKFNESLKMLDTDDFWTRILQTTAELLQSERASLFVYDEKSDKLFAQSAIGSKADIIKNRNLKIGNRIVKSVWKQGRALVVPNISKLSISPAPSDWKYKTESFISYPLIIGERKIGVLNVTDKVNSGVYDDFDLQLLKSLAPQIAVAIDRANIKNRAGEFEQLSVTDALTGLLNRRYLEERLAEELRRSNRHGYPMSFMMIDVDDFKSYNDTFLHPEGDKALQIVSKCLKETLRGADVAARYGGEEFSILLPQTTIEETRIIAERIRQNIENTEFPHRQITISIGIASLSLSIKSVEDLIESADKALFEAKKQGKNNVQIYRTKKQELQLSK